MKKFKKRIIQRTKNYIITDTKKCIFKKTFYEGVCCFNSKYVLFLEEYIKELEHLCLQKLE